jgi:recombination protein U
MRHGQGNRGKAFEESIIMVNEIYKARGKAIITKVPTEWIPIRQGGKIITAKVENKSIVDFLGSYKGQSIAFDAKECLSSDRIRWAELKDHQQEFLDRHYKTGGISFVFVSFKGSRYFSVPWKVWEYGLDEWKSGGAASVHISNFSPEWKVPASLDYLPVLDRLFRKVR